MSGNGFDTWTLELRGSGLSTLGSDLNKINQPLTVTDEHTNSSVDNGKDGIAIFRSRKHPSLNVGAFSDSNISSVKKNGTLMVTNSSFLREGWS